MTQNKSTAQTIPFPEPGVVTLEDGKDYRMVSLRLKNFRKDHPDWRVLTTCKPNNASVLVRAVIQDHTGRIIATGHAEELRNANALNRVSAVPIGETSAVGRALMNLGYFGTTEELNTVVIDEEDYRKVAARIKQFRDEHPSFSLISEILDTVKFNHHDIFLIKATVLDEKGNELATGHVEEFRSKNADDITYLNALETGETSAWGRALAFFKYHGSELATVEEIRAAEIARMRVQRRDQPTKSAQSKSQKPTTPIKPAIPHEPVSVPVGAINHVSGLVSEKWPKSLANEIGLAVNLLLNHGFVDLTFQDLLKTTLPGDYFQVEAVPRKGVRIKAMSFARQGVLQSLGYEEDTAENAFYLRYLLQKYK